VHHCSVKNGKVAKRVRKSEDLPGKEAAYTFGEVGVPKDLEDKRDFPGSIHFDSGIFFGVMYIHSMRQQMLCFP
jgi:hypothetical protein